MFRPDSQAKPHSHFPTSLLLKKLFTTSAAILSIVKTKDKSPYSCVTVWIVVLGTALSCLNAMAPARWSAWTLCTIGLALVAYVSERANDHFRHYAIQRCLLGLAWSALVTLLLFGTNLEARWGIIDDHDIVHTLGPDATLGFNEISLRLATHKEFGSPSTSWPRYRPAYYLCMLLECFVWGNHPQLWYMGRLAMCAVASFLIWNSVARRLNCLWASLFLLLLFSCRFWSDIWCRLGAGEAYATIGVALYLAGIDGLLAKPTDKEGQMLQVRTRSLWVLATIGAVLAMGSKENFLLLVPSTLITVGWLWYTSRLDQLGTACALLISAVGCLIAIIVIRSLHETGKDIYCENASLAGPLQSLPSGIRMMFSLPAVRALAIATLAASLFVYGSWCVTRHRSLLRIGVRAGTALGALVVMALAQWVFYGGIWPQNNRYDFPGVLALPFIGLVLAWAFLMAGAVLGLPGLPILRSGLLSLLGLLVLLRGFEPLRAAARHNAGATEAYCRHIDVIVMRLSSEPDRPVIIECSDPLHYEPVISVQRFLFCQRVANPIFLQLELNRIQDLPAHARFLAEKLRGYSIEGHEGLKPIHLLRNSHGAFRIGVGKEPGGNGLGLGCIWPLPCVGEKAH